jgi:hypothetical protein
MKLRMTGWRGSTPTAIYPPITLTCPTDLTLSWASGQPVPAAYGMATARAVDELGSSSRTAAFRGPMTQRQVKFLDGGILPPYPEGPRSRR